MQKNLKTVCQSQSLERLKPKGKCVSFITRFFTTCHSQG